MHFRNAKAAKDDAQAHSENAKQGWAGAKRWKKYYLQDRERKQATHGGLTKLKNSRLFFWFGKSSISRLYAVPQRRRRTGSGEKTNQILTDPRYRLPLESPAAKRTST